LKTPTRERARPPPFGAALLPVLPAHLVMGVDLARRDLLRGYVVPHQATFAR
jgi:hypothetical protein